MIQSILLSILLDQKKAVNIGLNEKVWISLEEKGLGEVVEKYLNGEYDKHRAQRGIMIALGVTSKEWKILAGMYTSMHPTGEKYARLSISLPHRLGVILEMFKNEGGKKSHLIAASLDNIISKIGTDYGDLQVFINQWLVTEKNINPDLPETVLEVRRQKANLDRIAENREKSKKKRKQREKEEMTREKSKEEKDSTMRQQKEINIRITQFKKEHDGRKPTREEWTDIMTHARKTHPIVKTPKSVPTSADELKKIKARQKALNDEEDKEIEKRKKKKKSEEDDDDIFEDFKKIVLYFDKQKIVLYFRHRWYGEDYHLEDRNLTWAQWHLKYYGREYMSRYHYLFEEPKPEPMSIVETPKKEKFVKEKLILPKGPFADNETTINWNEQLVETTFQNHNKETTVRQW